ncbi:MAG: hypothetical protein US52_C0006G0018 [candidate division WS6 bacterium GW2011_GWA2_37_6]|uniref:Uncharacterized protein n=1 Tax=candidate division WS6 bacterium GW2011_GWA2_37_6 TaxID=1619087 RepID=A0A0G0GZ18_9BACT|nr:MAG: hypothetical protein US52_C0006G0018 [candidate division WS6 bacterium GW2011_GWA2_37_6]
MAINLDVTNPKRFRIILLALFGFLILIIAISFTVYDSQDKQSDWIENKEQDPSKIEDITKALPYVEENYRISYSEAEKYYIVTYPGYKSFGEIELKTVLWFKQNTNLKSVQIKYGEIGGVTKDYDLNISAEEILKGNKYYQQTVKDAEYTEMEI